jgi:Rieske Fe-S protein
MSSERRTSGRADQRTSGRADRRTGVPTSRLRAASGLAALATTCSHLGCGVSWDHARKAFLCPCHGGVYGPDGAVLAGPPPRPLLRLPLVVDGGRVRLDASALDA